MSPPLPAKLHIWLHMHDFIPEAQNEKRPTRSTKATLFVCSCNASSSIETTKEETAELLFVCAIYEAWPAILNISRTGSVALM